MFVEIVFKFSYIKFSSINIFVLDSFIFVREFSVLPLLIEQPAINDIKHTTSINLFIIKFLL